MKQLLKSLGLSASLCLAISSTANAQYDTSTNPTDPTDQSVNQLSQYIINLGAYLGYAIQSKPSSSPNSQLLNPSVVQALQSYALSTAMGAKPVTAISQLFSNFVPSNSPLDFFNSYANLVYKQGTGDSQIFINPLVDQQTYQQDPVSQSVLNILGTPDFSFCISNDGKNVISNCSLKYAGLVSNNVIGTTPKPPEFFLYQYIQPFLPELNSNTLIAPLQYSAEGETTQNQQSGEKKGLLATDQLSAASNFIDFVTGAVVPLTLASQDEYSQLYATAYLPSSNKSITPAQQVTAQNQLANYLASLKVYAAQTSVVTSNLYYIFGKRLTQQQGTNENAPQTSQASTEYDMASWRLFNPQTNESSQQWINMINNASAATVQKETAVLLAEINYQLYLSRQQQERILLTNSIMLLQFIKMAQPTLGGGGGS